MRVWNIIISNSIITLTYIHIIQFYLNGFVKYNFSMNHQALVMLVKPQHTNTQKPKAQTNWLMMFFIWHSLKPQSDKMTNKSKAMWVCVCCMSQILNIPLMFITNPRHINTFLLFFRSKLFFLPKDITNKLTWDEVVLCNAGDSLKCTQWSFSY